jgi:Ubiquitin-activating enzyme E1 FCCH domain
MQYRNGIINSTTALISSGVIVPLGFVPDKFTILNYTKTAAQSGVGYSEWVNRIVPNGDALITTYTAGAPVVSLATSNGISGVAIGGDWQSTQYTITGITNANPGVVTVSNNQPTNTMLLENGMTVTISGVVGMTQVNTYRFIVANYAAGGGSTATFSLYDTFGNPVNTLGFGTYSSGGIANQISYPATAPILNSVTGQVVVPGQPVGNQFDIGYEGVSLGSAVLGSNGDVLWWEAFYSTPTGW